jgi:hypothetical protein
MQRLLQVMPTNSHHDILKAVEGIIVETIYHEFGNHVVQRITEVSDPKKVLKLVVNACKTRVSSLSRDLNGCRIIQRILERFDRG